MSTTVRVVSAFLLVTPGLNIIITGALYRFPHKTLVRIHEKVRAARISTMLSTLCFYSLIALNPCSCSGFRANSTRGDRGIFHSCQFRQRQAAPAPYVSIVDLIMISPVLTHIQHCLRPKSCASTAQSPHLFGRTTCACSMHGLTLLPAGPWFVFCPPEQKHPKLQGLQTRQVAPMTAKWSPPELKSPCKRTGLQAQPSGSRCPKQWKQALVCG